MTIWDLQKKYASNKNGIAKEIASMSHAQIKEVIDSCGTPQGKEAMRKQWEKLTGKKY